MFTFLMIIHVIISVALIIVILAQSSKGGALQGLAGGAASNVLGSQGASKFLKNATQILAVLFMINCVLLAVKVNPSSKTKSSKAIETMKKEKSKETTNEDLPELPSTTKPADKPVEE